MPTLLKALLLASLLLCNGFTAAAEKRQWTVLVYMVADNNLDPYSVLDFDEISGAGPDDEIAFVVQVDRSQDAKEFQGTRRFDVRKGTRISDAPLLDMGEQNMGRPDVLADFIVWGQTTFPAEHYALIIWNHGAGWRNSLQAPALGGGHKLVATDDTDRDELYNSEMVEALESAERRTGQKLALLGFDACLMSTIEIWYGLRNLAGFGVGSQDLEPGTGWFYDLIVQDLNKNPGMSAAQLSRVIVDSYRQGFDELKRTVGVSETFTLAAVDLSKIQEVADSLSRAVPDLSRDIEAVSAARDGMETYNDGQTRWPHLVDMALFFERITANPRAPPKEAKAVLDSLKNAVVAEAHSSDRTEHGSRGISIYFPGSQEEFSDDPFRDAYLPANNEYPVAFVRENQWPALLAQYLGLRSTRSTGHRNCLDTRADSWRDPERWWFHWIPDYAAIDDKERIARFIPIFADHFCNYPRATPTAEADFGRELEQFVESLESPDVVVPRMGLALFGFAIQNPPPATIVRNEHPFPQDVMRFIDHMVEHVRVMQLPQSPQMNSLIIDGMSLALEDEEKERLNPGSVDMLYVQYLRARMLELARTQTDPNEASQDLAAEVLMQAEVMKEAGHHRVNDSDIEFSSASPERLNVRVPEYRMAIDACKRRNKRLTEGAKERAVCELMIADLASQIGDAPEALAAYGRALALPDTHDLLEDHQDKWRLHWSAARASYSLRNWKQANDHMELAASHAVQMKQAVLPFPDAERYGAIFPNATISGVTQVASENVQAFFDDWHSRVVSSGGSVLESLRIADYARTSSGPFTYTNLVFPDEVEVLQVSKIQASGTKEFSAPLFTAKEFVRSDRCDSRFVSFFTSQKDGAIYAYYCSKSGTVSRRSEPYDPRHVMLISGVSADIAYELIYAITIKPIESEMFMSADPVLTIVPHSFLWGIAFSALGSDEGGRLIDRYAVRLAASTSQAVNRKAYRPKIRSALVVANPQSGWSSLTSAQAAARLNLGTNVRLTSLTREDATEGAVAARMAEVDLVHFSTHGFASAINPSASSIVLTPDVGNDGFMTVGEIAQMKLKARLIFVASCVTGIGVNLGSGPASLGAFISEFGRNAVITATLPLNDQTSRWMEEVFYTKLMEGGDPAVALREAQLVVKSRIPDPSFWAAPSYWGP